MCAKMKRKVIFIFLILLLVVSFLFINMEEEETEIQYHSSQLQKITVKDGTAERTDYLDVDGELTVAADIGYATVITTHGECNLLEQYFDEQGEPIRRSDGYYAVFRDSGMDSDSVATNFDQIFRTYSPQTERKVV